MVPDSRPSGQEGWLRRRPWLWIVGLILFFLAVDVLFLILALREMPEPA